MFKRFRKLSLFWKTVAVVRVYKRDDPKLVENYRPIYLICIENKIFEKCM